MSEPAGRPVLPAYVIAIDGAEHPVTGAEVGESLLGVLRERVGVAAVKDGCRRGECGACAVLVDGELRNACLVLAVTASGRRVTTAHGLGGGRPTDVGRAMAESGAVQCGYCTPAMVLAAHALLDDRPDPTDAEIRAALAGVQCRCGAYGRIVEAVLATARARASRSAGEGEGG